MATDPKILDARIAAAEAKLADAKSRITDEDREELAKRALLAKLEDEAGEAEREARDLDLKRRLDAAIESGIDSAELETLTIESFPDSFIIRRNGRAHARWAERTQAAKNGKKIDQSALDREYAIALVYDWNGVVEFDAITTSALAKRLTEHSGLVIPITNVGLKLNGTSAEVRKS